MIADVLLAVLPAGLLAWVYVGYPVAVAVKARVAPYRSQASGDLPTISIAIAVHNEAAAIAERLADALAQGGPGAPVIEVLVGSDGSDDDTAAIARGMAEVNPRVRVLELPRAGQTPTQHALFEAATGDVVVLTDAETRFAPGCLAALAEAFRDPSVGCATGRLEWRDEGATATSANEGLYWRYERWVRASESRAGMLTAVTGALLAVRRSAYVLVPAEASMDHLLPLYVRERGGRVVYVASAVATDRPISGMREQFRNRARTATRGIRSNLSMAGRLAPWRQPGTALAIWSHKLLRWATPWLLVWAGLGGSVLALEGHWGWAVLPVLSVAALASAGLAHAMLHVGRRPPRVLAFARAFTIVNLAFARAWIDVVRGRRIAAWHRTEVAPTER